MGISKLKDGRWIVDYLEKGYKTKRKYFGRGLEAEKKAKLAHKGFMLFNKVDSVKHSKTEIEAVKRQIKRLRKWYKDSEIETEAKTRFGNIDILTIDEIIEVKNIGHWKSGIGQLMAYSDHYPEKRLRLHLFRKASLKMGMKIFMVCDSYGISVTHEAGSKTLPEPVQSRIQRRKANARKIENNPIELRKAIENIPNIFGNKFIINSENHYINT